MIERSAILGKRQCVKFEEAIEESGGIVQAIKKSDKDSSPNDTGTMIQSLEKLGKANLHLISALSMRRNRTFS